MADRLRFYKDPLDTIAYTLNWKNEIGLKTVISSNWASDPGLAIVAQSNIDQTSSVLVSGGTVGNVVRLTNTVTDSSGLIFVRPIDVVVQNRLSYSEKRTSERLTFTVDWSDSTFEIATQTWLPVTGLTLSDQTFSDKSATVTVEGGTMGIVYGLRHRVNSVGGQILHKGFSIRII